MRACDQKVSLPAPAFPLVFPPTTLLSRENSPPPDEDEVEADEEVLDLPMGEYANSTVLLESIYANNRRALFSRSSLTSTSQPSRQPAEMDRAAVRMADLSNTTNSGGTSNESQAVNARVVERSMEERSRTATW